MCLDPAPFPPMIRPEHRPAMNEGVSYTSGGPHPGWSMLTAAYSKGESINLVPRVPFDDNLPLAGLLGVPQSHIFIVAV